MDVENPSRQDSSLFDNKDRKLNCHPQSPLLHPKAAIGDRWMFEGALPHITCTGEIVEAFQVMRGAIA